MATTKQGVIVVPLNGAEIVLYCEHCYAAPHSFVITISTHEEPGIEPASYADGLTAVCDQCGSMNTALGRAYTGPVVLDED